MARRRKSPPPSGDAENEATLDDVIVALQKSFSRVSYRSEERRRQAPEAALAVVAGPIEFTMSLQLKPQGSERLLYDKAGGVSTTISGTLTPDVRYQSEGLGDAAKRSAPSSSSGGSPSQQVAKKKAKTQATRSKTQRR